MGDRANVYVTDGDDAGVYLYTHWTGDELPIDVKTALAKRWRWDDPQYLARIIFERMIPNRHRGEETGFGISAQLGDNEHPIIRVDCGRKQVAFVSKEAKTTLHHWSFDKFIGMSDKAILKAFSADHSD